MDSLFKKTGSVHLDRATVGGGLTCECGLHLGCDVNGDCHGYLSKFYRSARLTAIHAHTAPGSANADLTAAGRIELARSPMCPAQEGSRRPRICSPRILVADVDGEEFEEA